MVTYSRSMEERRQVMLSDGLLQILRFWLENGDKVMLLKYMFWTIIINYFV